MDPMLAEIAALVVANGLTIEDSETHSDGTTLWLLSDPVAGAVIRVKIMPNFNGHPEFWVQSFASYAASYIVPIVTRLGDARHEVIQSRLVARSPAQD